MTYPVKTRFEVLDERFRGCNGDEWMERLHTGCRWTEGPAYFAAGRYLVFSDIPNDRHAALGRDDRRGRRLPPAGRLRQRAHRRPRRAGWSAASRATAGSPAPSTTARSPSSPTAIRASGSTAPTTWSSDPTARSGSPTRATASTATTRGTGPPSEIGALPRLPDRPGAPARCASSPTTSSAPTGWPSPLDERQLYIVDTRRQHIRPFDVADDGRCPAARSSPPATAGTLRRHPARRHRPDLGRRPRRRCTASTPTARCIGKLLVPRSSPT